MTSAKEMSMAPKIHPVWSGPGILFTLESSRPGPGVGVKVGVDIDIDVDVDVDVDIGVIEDVVVDVVVVCRFYKERACWPRPNPFSSSSHVLFVVPMG